MTLIATVYCTRKEIERFLSEEGVISFSDHDEDGVANAAVIDDCINEASQEIELYCRQRYSQASLSSSTLINRWAKALAAFFLCEARGNPPPQSLQTKVDRIYERLVKILEGVMALPGLPFIGGQAPTFSNLTVDRRYIRAKIRVTKSNSSSQSSGVIRHEAWEDYYDG